MKLKGGKVTFMATFRKKIEEETWCDCMMDGETQFLVRKKRNFHKHNPENNSNSSSVSVIIPLPSLVKSVTKPTCQPDVRERHSER